jgi:hypothetical protein
MVYYLLLVRVRVRLRVRVRVTVRARIRVNITLFIRIFVVVENITSSVQIGYQKYVKFFFILTSNFDTF